MDNNSRYVPSVNEHEKIIEALTDAYIYSIEYYSSLGYSWRGLTRRDYDRFRKENKDRGIIYPSSRYISQTLGSWSAFTSLMKVQGPHPRIDNGVTPDRLLDILTRISKKEGVVPGRVTSHMYDKYRESSEEKLPHRASFTRASRERSWDDTIAWAYRETKRRQ